MMSYYGLKRCNQPEGENQILHIPPKFNSFCRVTPPNFAATKQLMQMGDKMVKKSLQEVLKHSTYLSSDNNVDELHR